MRCCNDFRHRSIKKRSQQRKISSGESEAGRGWALRRKNRPFYATAKFIGPVSPHLRHGRAGTGGGGSPAQNHDELVQVYERHPRVQPRRLPGAFVVPVRLCGVLWARQQPQIQYPCLNVGCQLSLDRAAVPIFPQIKRVHPHPSMVFDKLQDVLQALVFHDGADRNRVGRVRPFREWINTRDPARWRRETRQP